MTKMPFNIYAALSKHGSHYWATQLHEELNKTNVFGNPQEQYTHTQQLIEWLEEQRMDIKDYFKSYKTPTEITQNNKTIDEVIAKLRGEE